IVHHEVAKGKPIILETPWIGKDKANQRPMYEAEIALLTGNAEGRFGPEFLEDVARLRALFEQQLGHPRRNGRDYAPATWELLQDKKQRAEDKREPMERLYDLVVEHGLFPDCSEEQINMRLVGYFAGIRAVPAEPRAAAPRTPPEPFHDPIPPAPGGGHPSAPRAAPRGELPRAASGPFSAQARNEPRPLPQPALLVFLDEPGVKAHRVLRHHRVLGEEIRQRRLRVDREHPVGGRNQALHFLRSEEHTSELQSRENLVCRL